MPVCYKVVVSKQMTTEVYLKMNAGEKPNFTDVQRALRELNYSQYSDWEFEEDYNAEIEDYDEIDEDELNYYTHLDVSDPATAEEVNARCTVTPDMFDGV